MEKPEVVIQFTIQYVPSTGAFGIQVSDGVDDVVRMGMLEMAKTALTTARIKAEMGVGSNLVLARPGAFKA